MAAVGYLDSSCVVAITLGEPGARSVATALRKFERLVSSSLLEAEVRAALARERVTALPNTFAGVDWILPDRPLTPEIDRVLAAGALRGADLWHIACALYLDPTAGEVAFLTLDAKQQRVAAAIGFNTARIAAVE